MFCADIGSSEKECTDRLTVQEEDRQLLSLCGEKEESIVIESEGGGLDVFVSIRSKNIFPKRGVLFQYKGQLLSAHIMIVNIFLSSVTKLKPMGNDRKPNRPGVGKLRNTNNSCIYHY
jgi:hypothetical protein